MPVEDVVVGVVEAAAPERTEKRFLFSVPVVPCGTPRLTAHAAASESTAHTAGKDVFAVRSSHENARASSEASPSAEHVERVFIVG
jgi:hypothetical protein